MTTTVRSVRVELEMSIDRYVRNARIAGRETDDAFSGIESKIGGVDRAISGLDESTAGLSKTSTEARAGQTSLGREIDKTGRNANSAERSIDKYSGRLKVFLSIAAGIGPAILPIGALGIPALAGLAAQGGFAAGALGASVLALRGVGDAVKALEKARLDPTVENMNAAQQVLNRMGPDAASLVLHLDALTKVRDKLQSSAAAGFIPGLDDALAQLEEGVPVARHLLREFGDISGEILDRGAKGITSDRFTEFFQYLQTNARPILNDTADALGHLAHAFASIFTSTASDQRAFTAFLRDSSEDFDHWASRLDSNTDFQDFLAYARENGPAVADALGSIVEAFAAIVEAAAPLGGPTLQILTDVADIVDSIASSPIGTPILASISAYSLLSTILPGVKKGYEGISSAQGKVEARLTAGRATLTTFAGDLRNVARYGTLATDSTQRLRTQLGPLVKGGAGLAALAIASSGAADGMGLTSTASLALLGYMVGGAPGAVAGGLVGAIKDFTANTGDAGAATKRWNAELKDGQTSLDTYRTILQGAQDDLGKMDDIIPSNFGDALIHGLNPQNVKLSFRALFGDLDDSDLGKKADEVGKLNAQYEDLITTATILGQATGQIDFGDSASMEQLTEILVRAKPAMDSLGISTDDLMAAMRDGSILTLVDRIEAYQRSADSSVGKTQAVRDAIGDLDDGMITTAQSAETLKNSLDALLGPQLGLSAATDAWTTALRHLGDDLDKDSRTLDGNSDAAIKNRAAIRDRVGALTDTLVASAQAGASAASLKTKLEQERQALIDAGVAAGVSRKDMRDYLNTLGLTPALVKTLVKADTADAEAKVRTLKKILDSLHSKDINIALHYQTIGNKPHAPLPGAQPGADGMTVPGPRYPYGDKVLIHAAPGEEIITNRHGEADRFRADRAAGRIPGYADGGSVPTATSGPLSTPLFPGEGPRFYADAYKHNRPFAVPPKDKQWPYQTVLTRALELAMEKWVDDWNIPFDPGSRLTDYDMRGFYKRRHPAKWTAGQHFPDTWKTPYDTRFSHESMYATADNPFYWRGDTLVDIRTGEVIGAADGATVPGARFPYRDRVTAFVAPGEEIVSNRHGGADMNRSELKAASRGAKLHLANGGTVEDLIANTHTRRQGGDGYQPFHVINEASAPLHETAKAADGTSKALKKLETAADKVKASYEKEKSKLDDLISQRDSAASSIAGSFLHDPFGNGVAGLDTQVQADTGDLDAMAAALATLVANGLDPRSALYQQLAASADVNTAQQLAQLSSSDLAGEATRFQHRSDEASALGLTVANQSGLQTAIEKSTAVSDRLEHRLHSLEDAIHDLKDLPKHVGDATYESALKGTREGSEDGTRAGQSEAHQRTATMIRTGSR